MILMIDNYDSFTYNLVQYLGELGADVIVHRNDKITFKETDHLPPAPPPLSPSPFPPPPPLLSIETVRYFGGKIPLLGVCIGNK